jgi:hypothetical protein
MVVIMPANLCLLPPGDGELFCISHVLFPYPLKKLVVIFSDSLSFIYFLTDYEVVFKHGPGKRL